MQAAEPSIFATTSPATGEPLDTLEATAPDEIDGVVRRAREAQAKWAELDVSKRVKAVAKVKRRLLERGEALARVIHRETGKPEAEALLGEILASADVVSYWADTIAEEREPLEPELDPL